MKKLLKETFNLWVKMRWLKTIDKETNKYNKIEAKRKRQAHIIHSLLEEYTKIYGNSCRKEEIGNERMD